MGKKPADEGYYWFHGQVKEGLYPNARKHAEKFEITQKQGQSEIKFMWDNRLGAPLSYDSAQTLRPNKGTTKDENMN